MIKAILIIFFTPEWNRCLCKISNTKYCWKILDLFAEKSKNGARGRTGHHFCKHLILNENQVCGCDHVSPLCTTSGTTVKRIANHKRGIRPLHFNVSEGVGVPFGCELRGVRGIGLCLIYR